MINDEEFDQEKARYDEQRAKNDELEKARWTRDADIIAKRTSQAFETLNQSLLQSEGATNALNQQVRLTTEQNKDIMESAERLVNSVSAVEKVLNDIKADFIHNLPNDLQEAYKQQENMLQHHFDEQFKNVKSNLDDSLKPIKYIFVGMVVIAFLMLVCCFFVAK